MQKAGFLITRLIYGLVESPNAQSTAILHISDSVNSLGRDFGITPVGIDISEVSVDQGTNNMYDQELKENSDWYQFYLWMIMYLSTYSQTCLGDI